MIEHNQRMSLAWHIAALHRAKKMPKLDKLLARVAARKPAAWEEQFAAMKSWVDGVRRRKALLQSEAKKHGRK